ncbi:MAG: glycosyltransferase family 4 protein [Actinomycetota bacterium]
MKVLHVNNVANVPDALVKGLREIGIDAYLYQPFVGKGGPINQANDPVNRTTTTGMGINKQGGFGKLSVIANRIADAKTLANQVNRERYDIVHIHYGYFGVLGILGGYHYWLHCHGTDLRQNLYHPLYKKVTTLSLSKATQVLYSTPDLKKHVEKARHDAAFLPNPIHTQMFKPTNYTGPAGKILLVSRMDKVKGIDIAFRALEKLKKRNPKVQIDAFAWGPEFERLKNKDFVNFIPRIPHEKVNELISNYQIVVGQFEIGAIGMSEMEAMACARPVICYFEYQDWYAEAPPLVLAKTDDEIVDKIEYLLANPHQCEEIGITSRDWIVKYHDYISVAKRLAEMYSKS